MAVPLMRSYTTPGLALNVFGPSTDDITGLTIQQLNRSNNILDCVNNPDPPGAAAYQTNVLVNGIQSGVSNFSVASSAASAGRVVFGPIPVSVGGGIWWKTVELFIWTSCHRWRYRRIFFPYEICKSFLRWLKCPK